MGWKISFFLVLILLVILLGIAYWLTPKGYLKAIMLAPQTINIQLSGVLEQQNNNNWTLVKDNRKITITNESQHTPTYLRRPQYKGQQPKIIKGADIAPGTPVTISLTLNPQSGALTVLNIIID